MSLLSDLESARLNVSPHSGWETNTNGGRDRIETVGIVNHWDAISGWPGVNKYLFDNRFGGILYHIVISRPGTVHLLSQRYVWHAGRGSGEILNVARAGGPIPDDSAGPDNMNGNPHFFGVCINYHPNDGPVPKAQYDSLVTVNRVLIDHFDLNVGQVFRHMDWTTRKRDIDTISLATFRDDIRRPDEEDALLPLMYGHGYSTPPNDALAKGDQSHRVEDVRALQDLLNFLGAGLTLDGVYGPSTIAAVKTHTGANTGSPQGREGLWLGGNQYGNLIRDVAATTAGGAHTHPEYVKDVTVER